MECTRIKELIYDYMKGLAPQEDTERVRTHLRTCSECNEFYNEVEESLVLLGKVRDVHAKSSAWEEIGERIKNYRRGVYKVALVTFGVAAILVIVLLATFLRIPEQPPSVAYAAFTARALVAETEYNFGSDSIITIPQIGSVTVLEEGTVLSFKSRNILQLGKGTILCAVTLPSGNFTVRTDQCDIDVKGTQFVTKVVEIGETLVDVRKGQVEIKSKKAAQGVMDSMVRITKTGEIESVKDSPQTLRIVLEVGKELKLDREMRIKGRIENPSAMYPVYIEEIRLHGLTVEDRFTLPVKEDYEKGLTGLVKVDAFNPLKFSFVLKPESFPKSETSNTYRAKFVYYVVKVKGFIGVQARIIESEEFDIVVK